jgi:hypothetical protein
VRDQLLDSKGNLIETLVSELKDALLAGDYVQNDDTVFEEGVDDNDSPDIAPHLRSNQIKDNQGWGSMDLLEVYIYTYTYIYMYIHICV